MGRGHVFARRKAARREARRGRRPAPRASHPSRMRDAGWRGKAARALRDAGGNRLWEPRVGSCPERKSGLDARAADRTQPCQSPTDACRPRGRPALGSVRNPSQRLGMEALRTDQTRVAAIGERFGAPTHRVPCAALNRAATAWLLLASAVRRGQGFLKGTEPSDSRAFAALHAWQAICAVSEIGFCSRFLRCDRHLNLSILGTNHVVASNVGAEWGQCRRIEVLRWFCQELWRSSILECLGKR